jgi:hypothetical protein
MIVVEKYTDLYDEELREWLRRRSLGVGGVTELPGIGYLAAEIRKGTDALTPVAAGFLRMCEGNYAMMDSFVTNPEANPEVRNKALDKIVMLLMAEGKAKGVKSFLFTTLDANTKARGERFGFKPLPHALMALKVE